MRLIPILAAAIGMLTGPGLAAADDAGHLSISHYGNLIAVTAPDDQEMDGHMRGILDQRVSVNFQDTPIVDVAAYLRKVTGENVVLASAVANAATQVTLKADGMSLGNVLDWVSTLGNVHIGYVHEAIYLSDKPVAQASVTRIYDVSDLVMPLHDFPGPQLGIPGKGPAHAGGMFAPTPATAEQPQDGVEEIIDIIKKVVSPGQWD